MALKARLPAPTASPAKKPGCSSIGTAIQSSPLQAWWMTATSSPFRPDLEEARQVEAGRVAQQGAPEFRQSWSGKPGGENAQAAWTCPQQYRCGPIVPSQAATSSAFFSRFVASCARKPAGPPAGSGTPRSAAGAVPGRRSPAPLPAAPAADTRGPRCASGSGRGRGSPSPRRAGVARDTDRSGRNAPKAFSNFRRRTEPACNGRGSPA